MDTVLLTYDLDESHNDSKHSELKEEMKKFGWSDHYVIIGDPNKTMHYLPNTTLWKKDTTPAKARADLDLSGKKVGAAITRYISVEYSAWDGMPGRPYKRK